MVPFERLNMAHFAGVPGKPDRHRSFEERRSSFAEANLGLTTNEALAEARRCFDCGVCNQLRAVPASSAPTSPSRAHPDGHGFVALLAVLQGLRHLRRGMPARRLVMTREGP